MLQLDRDDALFTVKRWLLDRLGIASPVKWQAMDISSCAAAARVLCLRQNELGLLHGVEDLQTPLNPRNEAAALAALAANCQVVCGSLLERQQQLQQLLNAFPGQLKGAPPPAAAAAAAAVVAAGLSSSTYGRESPEQSLHKWVISEGASTQLLPALFSSSSSSSSSSSGSDAPGSSSIGLRGCAAAADIPPGATAVSLPLKLLITYKTAAQSEFGQVLSRLGLDPETLAVVWTMVDRWDEESHHKPFWDALPQQFGTGLSVPAPLLELLKGCPEHAEFTLARQHVREQYAQLQQIFTVLLTAYAAHLKQEWFSEANFLWAVELWYAYAIQVKFPDSSIQPALAPFVSLMNHSPYPHIVHFSTVDPNTKQLHLSTFRTLQKGEQAFLSYGPLPNQQLLLFYGFAVSSNPFEEAVISVQEIVQQQQQQQQQQMQPAAAGGSSSVGDKLQLLQQLGLPEQYTLAVQQPLPLGLVPCLRVLCATGAEVHAIQEAVQQQQQQQLGSTAGGGSSNSHAAKQNSQAGCSKPKSKGKGGGSKSSSSKALAGQGDASSNKSSSSRIQSAADLEASWKAAATWKAVLGTPLSEGSEAASQQLLCQVLSKAKAPYEACLGKIAKRRQLQQLLQQKQQTSSSSTSSQQAFLAALETLCKDRVALYDSCGAASAPLS